MEIVMSGKHSLCVRASIFPEGRKIASRGTQERRVKIFVAISRYIVVRMAFYALRLRASVNSLASREGERREREAERGESARSRPFFFVQRDRDR